MLELKMKSGEWMIPFGKILSDLRMKRGLSQRKLSQVIGISTSMITLYEAGDRFPSLSTLLKIAHFFGVSTDFLLGNSMEEDSHINVEGLNQEQIQSIALIIDNYRKLMENNWEE